MQRSDYRNTLVVMAGLSASMLTGFLRQVVIAQQLGAGRVTDIYLVAFTLPEFVFAALPIVLTPAIMPALAACRQAGGAARAGRFGWRVTVWLGLFLLSFTALAWLSADLYLKWLAPGFNPDEYSQLVHTARAMLPAICLMGLGAVFGAVLQVNGHFARPALAAALYNLTFVISLWALPLPALLDRAAGGVALGVLASCLWQWPGTVGPAGPAGPGPSVGQVARLAGPLAAGYAVHYLILFIDRAMATTLGPGQVAALYYAYRLALVLGQLSGLAVSTALFPRLTEQIGAGNLAGARENLGGAVRLVWLIAWPASLMLIGLRAPLVRLLFERGAFDPAATAAVSAPLPWYAIAVLADALGQPLWRVIYASRRAKTVLAVNALQTAVRLAGNLILSPVYGYTGLAISACIGLGLQALVLGWLAHRRLGRWTSAALWRDLVGIGLAAVVVILPVYGLARWLAPGSPLITLGLCGGLGGAAYLALLLGLKAWGLGSRV